MPLGRTGGEPRSNIQQPKTLGMDYNWTTLGCFCIHIVQIGTHIITRRLSPIFFGGG